MKITKTNEEITYQKKVTTHTFEVNGKEIRVYKEEFHDLYSADSDRNIDENDINLLTEDELEALEDEIYDL